MPMVSVLICTRNRASRLRQSLATVGNAVQGWDGQIEVVVIDNGSEDVTPDLLAELSARHDYLRMVYDPRPGKSGALNRALMQLQGQVVLFTDDDVHVPRSWIHDMAAPILDGQCDAVAGRVVLANDLARSWLTPKLREVLAELTDVSGDLPGMVGANMAARVGVARSIGFDESLGPGARGFADDVLFNLRLKDGGWKIRGCDGPPVEHHLDPSRLTRAAMLDLAVGNGKSHAYVWHHWLHTDLDLLRVRKWRADLRVAGYRLANSPKEDAIAEREYDLAYSAAFLAALIAEKDTVPHYV
jgi:glycosyltransferase involved in cell wall biosynthesis